MSKIYEFQGVNKYMNKQTNELNKHIYEFQGVRTYIFHRTFFVYYSKKQKNYKIMPKIKFYIFFYFNFFS